jgi:hypothetical protein
MTITLYNTSNILPHYVCGSSVVVNPEKMDINIHFSTLTNKVKIMKFTQKLHAVKTSFDAAGYIGVCTEMVNYYMTDTKGIEAEVLAVADIDYNIVAAKDNQPLKNAWKAFTDALRAAGECLPDGDNGKLVFKFSSITNDKVKCRTCNIQYLTEKQVTVADQRAKDDAATTAERVAEDKKDAADIALVKLQSMTPLDIFLKVQKDIRGTYPDHDVKDVLSAGMGWYAEEEKRIAAEIVITEKLEKAKVKKAA